MLNLDSTSNGREQPSFDCLFLAESELPLGVRHISGESGLLRNDLNNDFALQCRVIDRTALGAIAKATSCRSLQSESARIPYMWVARTCCLPRPIDPSEYGR